MKSFLFKTGFIILFIAFFLSLVHVDIASSCEQDCRYERKKFAAEQMVKYKQQNKISETRSSTLVGVDALFM